MPRWTWRAERREVLRDEVGGALLLEAQFGMGMDVAAAAREIVVEFLDAGDELHVRPPPARATLPPPRPPRKMA